MVSKEITVDSTELEIKETNWTAISTTISEAVENLEEICDEENIEYMTEQVEDGMLYVIPGGCVTSMLHVDTTKYEAHTATIITDIDGVYETDELDRHAHITHVISGRSYMR